MFWAIFSWLQFSYKYTFVDAQVIDTFHECEGGLLIVEETCVENVHKFLKGDGRIIS